MKDRNEDRWAYLKTNQFSHCIFTENIDKIYLSIRHGKGKDEKDGYITLQYADENGNITQECLRIHAGKSIGGM
ncbi:MAG: hypothetical protein C0392_02055 [Syntrophus sp. (in: bacteria)]|nr:hypothetical protein [Syntrophus sp. (in: bacteria)]